MRRLNGVPRNPEKLFPLALTSALVVAAIEYPISQFYGTVPKSNTSTRMTVAAGMAFVAVLIAGAILKNREE
jgi:hypothetical protein